MQTSDIHPASNPLVIFDEWMTAAKKVPGIREPTAMTVSTISPAGELHARVVLCKKWSEQGFVFYSNYNSRKGHDLDQDAHAALLFYFDPSFRQIKISGTVTRTSRAESQAYWASRPRDSQLSQYISKQSEPIPSRAELEALWQKAERDFAGKDIPCPAHWGGYVVAPTSIEFWIGRPNRLHDTFHFEKAGPGWTFRRLCP